MYGLMVIIGLILIAVFFYFFRRSFVNDPTTINVWIGLVVILPIIIVGIVISVIL
jgi:hypothetical protein